MPLKISCVSIRPDHMVLSDECGKVYVKVYEGADRAEIALDVPRVRVLRDQLSDWLERQSREDPVSEGEL